MRLVKRQRLDALVEHYARMSLTYAEVGATAGDLPDGYAHSRRRTRIGQGAGDFASASRFLMSWEMHRRSGLAVAADGDAEVGRTVVLGLGVGLLLVVPCRVVHVVEESDRHGFAYGTLPDHPEQGEESFIVRRDPENKVWFEITVFSRPGGALARWAGPIARAIQSTATLRYERAFLDATF